MSNYVSLAELRAQSRENGDCDCFEHTQGKRFDAEKAAHPFCFFCFNQQRLEVHHISYFNRGWELSRELVVVCRNCHRLIGSGLRRLGLPNNSSIKRDEDPFKKWLYFSSTPIPQRYLFWTATLRQLGQAIEGIDVDYQPDRRCLAGLSQLEYDDEFDFIWTATTILLDRVDGYKTLSSDTEARQVLEKLEWIPNRAQRINKVRERGPELDRWGPETVMDVLRVS